MLKSIRSHFTNVNKSGNLYIYKTSIARSNSTSKFATITRSFTSTTINNNNNDTLESYRKHIPIQLRFGDNDIQGHVNNVAYYAFMDTAVNLLFKDVEESIKECPQFVVETGNVHIPFGLGLCLFLYVFCLYD